MPLLRRARAAVVCTALLATGCLVTNAPAIAATGAGPAGGCVQGGPVLRYLVVFDQGTPEQQADADISAACGTTTIYYPQIAVAVATSADPSFGDRMGPDRAYSAQAEAYYDSDDSPATIRKPDETEGGNSGSSRSFGLTSARLTGDQWDMSMIKAPEAHRINEGSAKVVVGVLDSGIDPSQPNLAAEIDPAASAGCVTGRPDTSPAAWAPTTSPHGTHVAGTIAGADDGQGTAGVAPGVKVASVKVVDDDGYIYPEAAVCGFMWAAQNGMTIANNSYFVDPWIFTCPSARGQKVVYEAMQRAVDYATAHGVLSIAAAGNEAVDLTNPGRDTRSPDNVDPGDQQQRTLSDSCVELPAGLPGVVTVSSVGADDLKAGYSSYGLGAIDLTAPGGDEGQRPAHGDPCVLSTVPGGYGTSCGTSMAAPHVSGVAALLASTHPHATPKQLTRLLDAEAVPVPCPADYDLNGTGMQDAYCTGDSSYNSFYGHGLVDALAAVTSGVDDAVDTTTSGTTSPSQDPAPPAAASTPQSSGPEQPPAQQRTPGTPNAASRSTPPVPVPTPTAIPPASVPNPLFTSLIAGGIW